MIKLNDLKIGEQARILGYVSKDIEYRRQLLLMGLTLGTKIKVIAIAPLGDPIKILVRGVFLCLRKQEAQILKLEKVI